MNEYTKHFINCKAVFQGGGCKGIAYVGAYKRAYERGVFFSELAGTSAGSIIAALIAAGATPKQLEKIVYEIDFSQFIKPAIEQGLKDKAFIRFCAPKELKNILKGVSLFGIKDKYGMFDSYPIEQFVEGALFNLTGKANLTFEDLIPDLHIVCSDLKNHSVKIWNKHNTPKAPIAKAVRASCSIPIFFTPTDGHYVDGGMLSNLPNFIFSDVPHYSKILCFRNVSGDKIPQIKTVKDYFSSLVETIVDGAISIQQLFNDKFDVNIDTGTVSSTDFKKMTNKSIVAELIDKGANAMDAFLDNEDASYQDGRSSSRLFFHTEEQVHSMVAELSLQTYKEVTVINDNTYWAWILFPTIVRWINNNTNVTVVVTKTIRKKEFEEEENARRRMLKSMGCQLYEVELAPTRAFIFKTKSTLTGIIYDKSEGGFEGRCYQSFIDGQLLSELVRKYPYSLQIVNKKISIEAIDEQRIIDLLQSNVEQYRKAKISFQNIRLNDIIFMNPFIRALKYRQIQQMFDLYGSLDIDKFSSASLRFPDGKESVIGPPVVEKHGDDYYLIEGNTRCIYAYRHGFNFLKMVVVESVDAQLPCNKEEKYKSHQVLISDQKLEAEGRYSEFNKQLFRHIEAGLRPNNTYLK